MDDPYTARYWRHEIAKAAMAALLGAPGNVNPQNIAERAVEYADQLIQKLHETEPPNPPRIGRARMRA